MYSSNGLSKSMDALDPTNLALGSTVLAPTSRHQRKAARGHRFLKGPIPWPWLVAAANLRGRTLHVAVVLWFLAGLTRSTTVKLGGRQLAELGVDRHAKYRALRALERAGLVRVKRSPGQNPLVTLFSVGDNG